MKKFIAYIFLMIFLSPLASHSGEDLSFFANVESLVQKGSFEQERKLKLISKPFISKGQFEINDEFFIWITKSPFEVQYRVTENLIEETVDGVVTTHKLEANPQMAAFAQVFASLVKLEQTVLEEHFELKSEISDNDWRLLLIPKQEPINKVFQGIVIRGDNKIRSIKTQTLSGDTNFIKLMYEE